VQSTADDATAGQKRTREDEAAANGEHPAKKVDAKE
jgi:lupus La protein